METKYSKSKKQPQIVFNNKIFEPRIKKYLFVDGGLCLSICLPGNTDKISVTFLYLLAEIVALANLYVLMQINARPKKNIISLDSRKGLFHCFL